MVLYRSKADYQQPTYACPTMSSKEKEKKKKKPATTYV